MAIKNTDQKVDKDKFSDGYDLAFGKKDEPEPDMKGADAEDDKEVGTYVSRETN